MVSSRTKAELVPGARDTSYNYSYIILLTGGGEFDLQHWSTWACSVSLEDAGEVVLIGGSLPGPTWEETSQHGHVSR